MSRKDFQILADALGRAGRKMDRATWIDTLNTITTTLDDNYANFNPTLFAVAAYKAREE